MTREELIALCDRGVVPQTKWNNRDSAAAQLQLAECRALLLAGCVFELAPQSPQPTTWWIDIDYRGFSYFEYGELKHGIFYVPKDDRLNEAAGEDWYL